jgi:hypothetical protein
VPASAPSRKIATSIEGCSWVPPEELLGILKTVPIQFIVRNGFAPDILQAREPRAWRVPPVRIHSVTEPDANNPAPVPMAGAPSLDKSELLPCLKFSENASCETILSELPQV